MVRRHKMILIAQADWLIMPLDRDVIRLHSDSVLSAADIQVV